MRLRLSNIEQRLWLPLVTALLVSNINGVIIVTIFLVFLLPVPPLTGSTEVVRTNLIALTALWAVTAPIGFIWTMKLWRPVHRWLGTGKPATAADRRLVLRTPGRVLMVPAAFWAGGVVAFTALNSQYGTDLAVAVAIAIALGGLGTGIFAYLMVQRILRPVTALAMADIVHDHAELPGVSWRILLSWGLGTGIPVLGIVLVGAGVLSGSLTGSVRQMAGTAVFLGAVALISGLAAMWISTRSLSEPLDELRLGMARVREGDHSVRVGVYDGSELGLLQSGFNDMVGGLAEREQLRDLFGRQVGAEVVQQSLERGAELGGEELDVAVLFCDVVGSTRLAVERPPHEVVELLNRFFAIVIDAVSREGGTVNKFLGDAGLCIFGAPLPHDDACGAALRAALEIRRRLRSELPGYDAGIGVSSGTVVAGNVGSAERFEYTVIGDAVNEAARLTDLAKQERGRILVSETCVVGAGAAGDGWLRAGRERLRGRAEPTPIFKPADDGAGGGYGRLIPAVKSRPHRSKSDGGRI